MSKRAKVGKQNTLILTYQKLNNQMEAREHSNLMFVTIVSSALLVLTPVELTLKLESSVTPLAGLLVALILILWRILSEIYDDEQYASLILMEQGIYGQGKSLDDRGGQRWTDHRLSTLFVKGKIGLHEWMRERLARDPLFRRLRKSRLILVSLFLTVSTAPSIYPFMTIILIDLNSTDQLLMSLSQLVLLAVLSLFQYSLAHVKAYRAVVLVTGMIMAAVFSITFVDRATVALILDLDLILIALFIPEMRRRHKRII